MHANARLANRYCRGDDVCSMHAACKLSCSALSAFTTCIMQLVVSSGLL